MAKATIEYRWINDNDFEQQNPVSAKIKGVLIGQKDKLLQLEIAPGDLCQMSVFGKNWNTLIAKFGDETDDWLGKTVRILQHINASDGKKIKAVEA